MKKNRTDQISGQPFLVAWLFVVLLAGPVKAQQFNSDNYLTMPHGTGTFILTTGERNSNILAVFALLPKFELNFQASLFWEDKANNSPQYFTTNIYGKYMFWVNKQNNGGAAVFLGVGRSPGFFTLQEYSPLEKNYWTAVPLTIPLFKETLFWDIMPGALVDFEYGDTRTTAWGFTYSTRLAIYKVIPETAIVGEVFGTEGDAYSQPEYRAGLRWEPNSWIAVAATYGAALTGNRASGFEIGIMIFTPQFLKNDFIKNNAITL